MIVAFPFSFPNGLKPEEEDTAYLFIRNFHQFWPGDHLVQVSDMHTKALQGVQEVHRVRRERDLGVWYFRAFHTVPHEEFLRLDYDCFIHENVDGVFASPFDIAIAREDKGCIMNNGVVFVKNRDVLQDGLSAYVDRTKMDGWSDIQKAMQIVIDSGHYRVRKLDQSYNLMWQWPLPCKPKILHFKGVKKRHMKEEYERARATLG